MRTLQYIVYTYLSFKSYVSNINLNAKIQIFIQRRYDIRVRVFHLTINMFFYENNVCLPQDCTN